MIRMLVLLFFTIFACANGAKILGVFPMPGHSHFFIGFRLMKELADRGHQVSMISPFPREKPIKGYTDISIKGIDVIFSGKKMNLAEAADQSPIVTIQQAFNFGNQICDYTLSADAVQDLLKSEKRFDLIIVEDFVMPALTAFSVHFKAPFILLSAIDANIWNNNLFGNPAPSSYIPHPLTSYTSKMDFFERLNNLFISTFDSTYRHLYFYPEQNRILHKYLPEMPQLEDIMHNASLILLNSHSSVNDPVPHLPNMIQIGGFHVDDPKELPEGLRKFLDDSSEGVVYFSMGSNLKSAYLHPEKRNAILKAFARLKQKVLWKFETDEISNLPENVRIEKWLPQSGVLAHPNVKVFISHGGMLSNLESVYHGVPIIGIPIVADQRLNINAAVSKGYAVRLHYNTLSEESLLNAINEVLHNPDYTENVKQRSRLMKDQPVKPMDTAVYWVEYAIRNRGHDNHFRSASLDLPWYKLYMLDIAIFLASIAAGLSFLFYSIGKRIIKLSRRTAKLKTQ